MLLIKKEFIQEFSNSNNKTKADLFAYIYEHQMNERFYEQYLYNVLVASLKNEFSKDFWTKYQLDKYVTGMIPSNTLEILVGTKDVTNTGRVDFDFEQALKIIDKNISNDYPITSKLDLVKTLGNMIDNHSSQEFLMINTPYKSSINDLVDQIKLSLNYERTNQFVKGKRYRRI